MAEWDTAYINDLPDSAFASVESGGTKDDEGKTVPRSLRHYPHHNAADEVDRPHLANALARVAQADTTSEGRGHLEAHASELGVGERSEDYDLRTMTVDDSDVQLRSLEERVIRARIVPFNEVVDTPIGLEMFKPGAFAQVEPKKVKLTLEHKGSFGPPFGRGISIEERSDGAYMDFKVSKTQHGDEALQLAADGVTEHVSIVYRYPSSKGDLQYRSGQRMTAWDHVDLREVGLTWKPIYERAAVLEVRSQQEEAAMADQDKAVTGAASTPEPDPVQVRSLNEFVAAFGDNMNEMMAKLQNGLDERMGRIEEQQRSQFVIPGATPDKKVASAGEWMQYALRALSGERISDNDLQYRALADVITSDNLGVVPDTFLQNELIGVIDPRRPFMSSTRRLPTPTSGMTLHVPVLEQRPIVGLQSEEKSEIASQAIKVTSQDFPAVTKAGGIDISLQLLKLSDPSFLDLALRLMAEAYAVESETEALEALLGADVDDGNTLDPAAPHLGSAFVTAFDVIRGAPDTIWLSSNAVGAFIDAVSPQTGLPMYSSITANATAGGGITGTVSGLRVVHAPVLGGLGADVIVGPSSGFAWAEAGTYNLQVDVPSRAGRDVAVVGILWYAPYYPTAFTVYTLAS